ncbi:MAG: Fe-S-cluster containining protein [Cocleimonas sp.]|jgi:Fe-S-cluster containining protein
MKKEERFTEGMILCRIKQAITNSISNKEISTIKECNSCGKCCIKYSNGQLSASENEIEYWEIFKPEIAAYVNNSKIWSDPKTGNLIELCPWLRKETDSSVYTCAIYFDRPEDCQFYPSNIAEMIRDECEMLEDHDVENPEKSQLTLDKIMADSRTPY